ncbi:MAG: hypothetical protein IPJ84_18750 [Bdellovibrionales bacterium]|nr:hypothetical protein [Bdellovibrionales bacterium]
MSVKVPTVILVGVVSVLIGMGLAVLAIEDRLENGIPYGYKRQGLYLRGETVIEVTPISFLVVAIGHVVLVTIILLVFK